MVAYADTLRLQPAGDTLWMVDADPAYAHPGGRFGGYTASLLLQSAMLEPGDRGDPLSLTVLFTDAVNDGPAEIATRLLRSGARLQFWRAEVHQHGKVCAHAQITFGKRRTTIAFTDAAMPEVVPPEDLSGREGSPPTKFGEQLISRWMTPSPLHHTVDISTPARSLVWVRHANGHTLDYALMACLLDYAPPRVMFKRPRFMMSSTVSMNCYFHASPEEIASVGSDWMLSEVDCRRAEGGYFDHQIKLWSRSGALLATSEQVAAFRD